MRTPVTIPNKMPKPLVLFQYKENNTTKGPNVTIKPTQAWATKLKKFSLVRRESKIAMIATSRTAIRPINTSSLSEVSQRKKDL
nr:hypothetical protein [Bacteroidetes bacterium endosymbiont of Geopemphigus sp.]